MVGGERAAWDKYLEEEDKQLEENTQGDLDMQELEEAIESVREGGKKELIKKGERIQVIVERIDPVHVTEYGA